MESAPLGATQAIVAEEFPPETVTPVGAAGAENVDALVVPFEASLSPNPDVAFTVRCSWRRRSGRRACR